MDRSRLNIAKIGESFAVKHLKACGCEILARNYRALRGEIDIIVRDGRVHCFCGSENAAEPQIRLTARGCDHPETATNLQGRFSISAGSKSFRRAVPF